MPKALKLPEYLRLLLRSLRPPFAEQVDVDPVRHVPLAHSRVPPRAQVFCLIFFRKGYVKKQGGATVTCEQAVAGGIGLLGLFGTCSRKAVVVVLAPTRRRPRTIAPLTCDVRATLGGSGDEVRWIKWGILAHLRMWARGHRADYGVWGELRDDN